MAMFNSYIARGYGESPTYYKWAGWMWKTPDDINLWGKSCTFQPFFFTSMSVYRCIQEGLTVFLGRTICWWLRNQPSPCTKLDPTCFTKRRFERWPYAGQGLNIEDVWNWSWSQKKLGWWWRSLSWFVYKEYGVILVEDITNQLRWTWKAGARCVRLDLFPMFFLFWF